MRGRFAPILLALLLATPLASAGWLVPTKVHVAPYHVGDVLRYDGTELEASPKGSSLRNVTQVDRLDGPGHAVNSYGVDRAAMDAREELSVDGVLTRSAICHFLPDGRDAFRTDYLVGGYNWSWHQRESGVGLGLPLVSQPALDFNETFDVSFNTGCALPTASATTLEQGQRVPVREVDSTPSPQGNVASAPAEATTFHGRDALALRWDVHDLDAGTPMAGAYAGTVTATLADGLPGIARLETHVTDLKDHETEDRILELVGFAAGSGAPVLQGDARIGERNPQGDFRPFEPLRVDDSAFGFPYAYDEAWHDLVSNPTSPMPAWLKAHPGASLVMADYELDANGNAGVQDTEGIWSIALGDGHAQQGFYARRSGAVLGAGSLLPSAAKPVSVGSFPWSSSPGRVDPSAVPPLAGSATIRAIAEANGLDVPHLKHAAFYVFAYGGASSIGWNLADISGSGASSDEGHVIQIDAVAGGATAVAAARRTADSGSLLAQSSPGGLDASQRSSLSALAGPGFGAGLAGGAALTGAALLLLAIKFLLVPLFTRLRREGLLDNPVRARLYERVRAEPGIHLAELVDFAAIGEGATRHHLDQLVKHRLLARFEQDAFVRFFAAGEVPPSVARREAILRAGSLRAVYELYCASPGITLREAGARLGLSAPSVHRAKKRLEKEGLLPAAPEAEVSAAA